MQRPKERKIEETEAQKQQREVAERENISAIQSGLQQRTRLYQRLRSPRMSLATGRVTRSMAL